MAWDGGERNPTLNANKIVILGGAKRRPGMTVVLSACQIPGTIAFSRAAPVSAS